MTRDKLLRELHRMLTAERVSAEWDALHAAIALLTPPETAEIEAARRYVQIKERIELNGEDVGATLDRALDALAREQAWPNLEARLAKIREVLGVEPEETAPLAEVARILRLCQQLDAVRAEVDSYRDEAAAVPTGPGANDEGAAEAVAFARRVVDGFDAALRTGA